MAELADEDTERGHGVRRELQLGCGLLEDARQRVDDLGGIPNRQNNNNENSSSSKRKQQRRKQQTTTIVQQQQQRKQ